MLSSFIDWELTKKEESIDSLFTSLTPIGKSFPTQGHSMIVFLLWMSIDIILHILFANNTI
jgi:hypothetical protein